MDTVVEHLNEELEDFDPGTAVALGEDIEPQEHHRSCLGDGQRVADADRVTANEVELKLFQFIVGNVDIGEAPKARVDAVNDLVRPYNLFDNTARFLDELARGVGKLDLASADGDVSNLTEGEW